MSLLLHHKKKDRFHYTKKHLQDQEVLNKKSGNDKPNNYSKSILLVFGVIILMSIVYQYNRYSSQKFESNSIESIAVVKNIKYNNRLVNQLDGARIENYLFEYFYVIDGIRVDSYYQIDDFEYEKYFDKSIKIGDTIEISYKIDDQSYSKIKYKR